MIDDRSNPNLPSEKLAYEDAEALDRLVAADFNLDQVDPAFRERASRLMSVLGMLDAPLPSPSGTSEAPNPAAPCTCDEMVGRCVNRIRQFDVNPEHVQLSPADEDALEALVQANMDPSRVASGMRDRAAHQARVLSLLDTAHGSKSADALSESSREQLVARTLATITRSVETQQDRLRFIAADRRRERPRLRVGDLISVAAVLLIAGAVIWPVLSTVRESGRQAACLANLNAIAGAFSRYANDNREAVPMASASLGGTPWWNVGSRPEESNSANLYTLKRVKYASMEQLACAGNPEAVRSCNGESKRDWDQFPHVSFSFMNLFGRAGASTGAVWHTARPVVLLADRSSVVVNAHRGARFIDVMENSPNHAGVGQNVLLSDLSARWLKTPMITSDDNIWLPQSLENAIRQAQQMHRGGKAQPLRGVETPDDAADGFVCP